MKNKNLKLIARTEEDLKVVSAHLQDSIVKVSDIAKLQKNKNENKVLDKINNIVEYNFNRNRGKVKGIRNFYDNLTMQLQIKIDISKKEDSNLLKLMFLKNFYIFKWCYDLQIFYL